MNDQRKWEVAEALDATPELLPFIPELIADLWALGSSPKLIVEWLRSLSLPPASTRVLDLGCGKGAVAITLAKEFGFRVLGVDLFEPFIRDAWRRAEEMDVTSLCNFKEADMRDTLQEARNFNVVIYTSVGRVLGRLDHCVEKLRQSVCVGGYMIIDDGFLVESSRIDRPGYKHCATHDEAIKHLTAHGDALLREKVFSVEETMAMNRSHTELIRKKAERLARQHPETANSFFEYVERQERESEIIEKEVMGAMWLLLKEDLKPTTSGGK